MAIRTKTQIITDAISYIASKIPGIATFVGSVVRDLVIESPAQEFDNVYSELSHTQQLQSIVYADQQSTDELDALAENYGLIRLDGRAATGTVTFQISNFSTLSSDVSIPTGTVVSTLGSSTTPQVSFITTQSLLFQASLAPSYFNPTTGLYELTATIQAQSIGAITNVAAGSIRVLISLITGVTRITNTVATTGGTDIESNTDFARRIQVKLTGNNLGTATGIISRIKDTPGVIDAITVTPNDPEMMRSQFGGEVDAYVIGQTISTTTDIDFYLSSGSQDFILQRQPSIDIISVSGIAGSLPYTFIQGVDYNYILDPTTLFNNSTRLKNKIVFNIGGTNPDNGTNITIVYTYNSLIETLQAEIDADDGHIVTTDILVKEAAKALIDITADVKLFPGNIASQAISDIQTALSTVIDALGLGKSIDRSDVISIIESVSSVDQVNVNTLILSKNFVPLPPTEQRLQIFKTEYAVSNTITLNIV